MSRRIPCAPKGIACSLHLSEEYQEGYDDWLGGITNSENPYDFFDDYEDHYAWDIGWQHAKLTNT